MTPSLDTIHLAPGLHETREDGVCLLEAVAWFAGKAHTDHPPCVSPVLGAYGRALNDALPDDTRQRLIPVIPSLPGTAGDGKDEARAFMAVDWLLRVYVPAWCDLVPALAGDAAALRDLPPVRDLASEQSAFQVIQIVRDNAASARAAAWAAAGAAARAAARAAAWAAAGATAGDAARAAARAAARDAAGDAAWAAAGAAAGDAAWAAAWAAARDALAPTVRQLQESAIALFPALIAGEWPDGVQ